MSADSDLLSAVPVGPDGRDWPATAPGLLARITEQTADAGPGIFATLVNEPGFLAAADPATLGPLLWATGPQAYDAVRAYRRARPLLGGDVNANAAYLAEATRALTGAHLAAGAGVRPLYRTHLAAARRDDTLFTLSGHNGMVGAVAFGTARGDGEAGEGRLLLASCSDDRTVRLWDPLTGMSVGGPLTGHSGDVYWVAADNAPDGRLILASGGLDRTVQLWDASTGVPIGEPLTGHTGAVYMLAFATVKRDTEAGGGRWLLASASEDTTLRIWDPLTGMPIGEPLTGHNDVVWSVTFATAPDGVPFLVSASWDGTVRFWDPLTQSQSGDPLEEPGVRVVAPATSPDGRFLLATGNIDGAARVWDLSSRTLVSGPLASHSHHVGAVAFATTPDGQFLLATTAHDDPVRLWDPLTGTPVGEPLTPRWGYGYALSFGTVKGDGEAGGQRLLLASHSGKDVVLWDPLTAALATRPIARHPAGATAVALTAVPGHGLLLASASTDDTVRLWDPLAGVPAGELATGCTDPLGAVAFGTGPDGPLLAACSGKVVRVWDPSTGQPVTEPLAGHTGQVRSVAFGIGPDGLLLASAGDDQMVLLWDPLAAGTGSKPLAGHSDWVDSVAFGTVKFGTVKFGTVKGDEEAGGGRLLLASGGGDRTLRVWDPLTGGAVGKPLTGHTGAVRSVAFATTPDGRLLMASASDDTTVRVWDPLTGAPVGKPLVGHTGWVRTLAFGAAQDGRLLLASGGGDKTVRIWDVAARHCLTTIRRRSTVLSLAMAGRLLAVGDDDGLSVLEPDASALQQHPRRS